MKFLCDQCKAKYQIADEKVQGKTLRMKCRKCGHVIEIRAITGEGARPSTVPPAGTMPATANPTMQLDSLSDDAAAAVLANPSIPTAPRAPTAIGAKPAAPRPGAPQRPGAPPRPGAGSQARPAAAPKPAPRPQTTGAASGGPSSALSSAFNKSMGGTQAKGAEIPASNAPTDPPAEEWYVAIDEVPVGPIRHTDLRMKYGQGAVTDDSLVWREGFEEWRPLRTLPDLHMLVREEVSQPRGSLLPGQASKQQGRIPTQGATSSGRGAVTPRPSTASQPSGGGGRSNVIPFQRQTGAAARKIDEQPEDDEVTRIAPSPIFPQHESPGGAAAMAKAGISGGMAEPRIVEDPFASKPMPSTAPTGGTHAIAPPAPSVGTPMFPSTAADAHMHAPREPSVVERLSMLSMRARGASKGTVALVGAACLLLGVLIAVLVVRRIVVVEEKVVEKQVAVPVSASAATTGNAATSGSVTDISPSSSSTTGPKIAKIGGTSSTSTTSAGAPTTSATQKKWGGIDDGPPVPTDGTSVSTGGNEGALDGKLVGEVAQRNAVGVRKVCYEKLVESGAADAKINVHIRPDGGVSGVDLMSGSPPAFASCVQKLAYNWHFPTSGSGGTFPIPYIFK